MDDSIVRGTTCKARVNNLKEAGAKEVHVLVSCPPHMNPCVYGIDFPDRSKLMAANHSLDDIRKYLNADSLHYLSQEGMVKATGLPQRILLHGLLRRQLSRCRTIPRVDKHIIERRNGRVASLGETLAQGAGADKAAVAAERCCVLRVACCVLREFVVESRADVIEGQKRKGVA